MNAQVKVGLIINTSSVQEGWPMSINTPYSVARDGVRMLPAPLVLSSPARG